jgi:hypothetical protein
MRRQSHSESCLQSSCSCQYNCHEASVRDTTWSASADVLPVRRYELCYLIIFFIAWSMWESELLYDWRFTANQFVLARSPLRPTTRIFIFQLNTCGYSPYITSSLTRGWICRLQLLLVLPSAVILGSESHGTHDHILLSLKHEIDKVIYI